MIIVVAMMVGVSPKTATRIDMKNWLKAIGIVILIIVGLVGLGQAVYHYPIVLGIFMGFLFLVGFTYTIKKDLDKK